MARLILTRLVTLIPLMFVITSIVFFMVRFVPGDPARIMVGGQRISEQNLANIRGQYRLDQPLLTQYRLWVGDLAERQPWSLLPPADRSHHADPGTPAADREAVGVFVSARAADRLAPRRSGGGSPQHLDRRRGDHIRGAGRFVTRLFTGILLILVFSYKLGWLPRSARVTAVSTRSSTSFCRSRSVFRWQPSPPASPARRWSRH